MGVIYELWKLPEKDRKKLLTAMLQQETCKRTEPRSASVLQNKVNK
jgi:hypothetical protein